MKKTLSLLIISIIILSLFSVFNISKAQVVGSGSIDSGLVGYWRLDENSGVSTLDSSGNSNTGTITGASWTTGKFNNALSFNGSTNNYVSLPNLNIENIPFTVSVWFKPNIQSFGDAYYTIVGQNNYLNQRILLRRTDSKFLIQYGNTPLLTSNAVTNVTNLVWNMVTYVYNGTYENVYINGVFDSAQIRVDPPAMNYSFYLGQTDTVNYPFLGSIDSLRIYIRALSNSEVSTLYNGYSVSVTHDLGSTITPNGTINVGVDQNQSFVIGSNSGYINWINYFDNVPFASTSLYSINGIQSSHSLFITSQFIGSVNPTNSPINTGFPIGNLTGNIGNFPYLAQILLVSGIIIMLMLIALYMKKKRRF